MCEVVRLGQVWLSQSNALLIDKKLNYPSSCIGASAYFPAPCFGATAYCPTAYCPTAYCPVIEPRGATAYCPTAYCPVLVSISRHWRYAATAVAVAGRFRNYIRTRVSEIVWRLGFNGKRLFQFPGNTGMKTEFPGIPGIPAGNRIFFRKLKFQKICAI